MSNGTTTGDVNHVYQPGHNGASKTFSPAHCAITIVGNWQGQPNSDGLIQYWWGVTPNKVYLPQTPHQHTITWSLDIQGLSAGHTHAWASADWDDSGHIGDPGGIVMDTDDPNPWLPAWGTPKRIAGGNYELVIPEDSGIVYKTTFKYTVMWTLGASRASFDRVLEFGVECGGWGGRSHTSRSERATPSAPSARDVFQLALLSRRTLRSWARSIGVPTSPMRKIQSRPAKSPPPLSCHCDPSGPFRG